MDKTDEEVSPTTTTEKGPDGEKAEEIQMPAEQHSAPDEKSGESLPEKETMREKPKKPTKVKTAAAPDDTEEVDEEALFGPEEITEEGDGTTLFKKVPKGQPQEDELQALPQDQETVTVEEEKPGVWRRGKKDKKKPKRSKEDAIDVPEESVMAPLSTDQPKQDAPGQEPDDKPHEVRWQISWRDYFNNFSAFHDELRNTNKLSAPLLLSFNKLTNLSNGPHLYYSGRFRLSVLTSLFPYLFY